MYRYVLSTVFILVLCQPAVATYPYYKVFKSEYLDKLEDRAFAQEANKASNRCFMCHQGKSRKNRNALGLELSKLLDFRKDMKDTEKISAALKKALKMRLYLSEPDKNESFINLLNASKWPAGNLNKLKKELPKKE